MVKIISRSGELLVTVWTFVISMTTEEIALYSLIITVIIYFLTKRSEIKMKKHESRREQYKSFVSLIKQIYEKTKNKNTKQFEEQARKVMFDAGSAFAIYGSRKLYKEFQFFRIITTDETIQNLKFFDKNLVLLSLGRMLKIMRKEVGLNRDNTDVPTMLNFMINETYKAEMKTNFIKSEYSRIRILHTLWLNKLLDLVFIKKIYYVIIKPILVLPFLTCSILIKRIIINPVIYIVKLFKKEKT